MFNENIVNEEVTNLVTTTNAAAPAVPEVIATASSGNSGNSGKGFKVAAGVGLTVLGFVAYKYIIKPVIAKIKAQKAQQAQQAQQEIIELEEE